jgi:hypothetical protein
MLMRLIWQCMSIFYFSSLTTCYYQFTKALQLVDERPEGAILIALSYSIDHLKLYQAFIIQLVLNRIISVLNFHFLITSAGILSSKTLVFSHELVTTINF